MRRALPDIKVFLPCRALDDHRVDVDSGRDVHVIPCFAGEREHEPSNACWCAPIRDAQEPLLVVHHRRAEA
jgi:hypothetical protein